MHARASDVLIETAELLLPQRRMLPSEAAAKYLRNDRGSWSPDLAPAMIEPLNMLASRRYRGIVVVGPARSSKTFSLVHGAITHAATCTQGDILLIQMSQDAARDFSKTEVDRVFRYSPELAARLSPRPQDVNVYDRTFRTGAQLRIGWPVIGHVSSKTVQTVLLTDYERAQDRDDVGGEGTLWDLALKRTETFMSRGVCLAESSPGDDYAVADWRPSTPHEAPPARGIASLYNNGTRARWYWQCKHCAEYFQAAPGPAAFALPEFDVLEQLVTTRDLQELAQQYARVPCRHCGGVHEQADRVEMNRGGRWLHEGERIDADGNISGTRRYSPTASYWLGGVAASFQTWEAMIYRYLAAVQTYVRIGDEGPLKTSTNTDLAASYLPRSVAKKRSGAQLRKRIEAWPQGTIPAGVHFLTAAVDVQSNAFVIQVHGWGAGLQWWVIDRFKIAVSKRLEGERFAPVNPAAYLEDWALLRDALVGRKYPLADSPGVHMPVRLTLCDSGGTDGVTARAYDFWRALRREGHGKRIRLVKGSGTLNAPRVRLSFPDSTGRKDRINGGRGDVPVLLLNTNLLKDSIANDLARETVGPGFVHLPDWLPSEVFDELTAESRGARGWVKGAGRNEAFDLAVYNRAATILMRAEKINWDRPPSWARPPTGEDAVVEDPAADLSRPAPIARPRAAQQRWPRMRKNWVRNW